MTGGGTIPKRSVPKTSRERRGEKCDDRVVGAKEMN